MLTLWAAVSLCAFCQSPPLAQIISLPTPTPQPNLLACVTDRFGPVLVSVLLLAAIVYRSHTFTGNTRISR